MPPCRTSPAYYRSSTFPCEHLAQQAEAWGPLAGLVNNAGITQDGLTMRMKDEAWDEVKVHVEKATALPEDLVKPYLGVLHLVAAAGLAGSGQQTAAEERLADAQNAGDKELADASLKDLEALRELIAAKL